MGKAGEERWSAGESAPVNIDTTKFSRCSNISGDDAEDTALLEGMHKDAQKFASSQKWCGPIQEEYLAFGVGGIIAVFLFKIRPLGDDVDPWIWVIVGDVPSALTTATAITLPATATARFIGHGGSASLPNRPRRWPLWGGLASKRWVLCGVVSRLRS